MSRELSDVIAAIKAEGRKPTLALVKARLTSTVPLPTIIRALQGGNIAEVADTPSPPPFTPAQQAWITDYVAAQLAPYQAALAAHGIALADKDA